jgi:hypothetical protein
MDLIALKSDRNKRFTIQQFEMMTQTERDTYNKNIVCDECGADAFYRKAAKDGKTACFGANHVVGCNTASGSKSSNSDGDEEANEIEMSLDFDIAWNYEKSQNVPKGLEVGEEGEKVGKNQRKYIIKPPVDQKSKISISTILKCAEYNILFEQMYIINVPEEGLKQLKDVVFKLEDINDGFLEKNLFMWGKMRRFSDMWINTPYLNNISIRIDDTIQVKFWNSYKNKIKQLLIDKNGLIIIFGKVKKSAKGNYYIDLKNPKYFCARKAKVL